MTKKKILFDLKDVHTLVLLIPKMIGKAYVTLVLSSGLEPKEAKNLTIGDLIKACESEFSSFEEKTLTTLLKKDPTLINPMWVLDTNGGKKITFSSKESTFYLFFYLKGRQASQSKEISFSDKLFSTGKRGYSDSQIYRLFKITGELYLNNHNIPFSPVLRYMYEDGEISPELKKIYKFTSSDLKDYFDKTCERYLPEFEEEINKLIEHMNKGTHTRKKRKLIQLFSEGLPEDDKYYLEFTKDKQELLRYYHKIQPHLTAKNYDDPINWEMHTDYPEFDDYMEKHRDSINYWAAVAFKTNKIRIEKTADKEYTEGEIKNILDDFIINNFSNSLYDPDEGSKKLVDVIISEAKKDNEIKVFSDSEDYLHELFKYSYLKWLIKDELNFKTVRVGSFDNVPKREGIISKLESNGVFELFKIDKNVFNNKLYTYLKTQKENNQPTNVDYNVIGELLYLSLPLEEAFWDEEAYETLAQEVDEDDS